jgi:hypothetical protein
MVALIRTAWSGTTGGPGINQLAVDQITSSFGPFSAAETQAAVNAVRAFWEAVKAHLPDEITLTTSPVVDVYLSNNGNLAWSSTAASSPASVIGTSTVAYSMPAGMKVNLNTGVIRNGRRVRGSIFIVPAAGAQTTGGLALGTARTTVNTAGTNLMAALATAGLKLQVWSRPLKDSNGVITRDGATADVQNMETNEKIAILRGRRD